MPANATFCILAECAFADASVASSPTASKLHPQAPRLARGACHRFSPYVRRRACRPPTIAAFRTPAESAIAAVPAVDLATSSHASSKLHHQAPMLPHGACPLHSPDIRGRPDRLPATTEFGNDEYPEDDFSSEDSLAAVQQPATGSLNVRPFPLAVPHPWCGIAGETPWLCRAVSDTPALVAIRTHAECCIAGVLIPADVTIIAIAVPVVPDVPEAVGFDVDRSRVLRMPDGPLNPAVLDPSDTLC